MTLEECFIQYHEHNLRWRDCAGDDNYHTTRFHILKTAYYLGTAQTFVDPKEWPMVVLCRFGLTDKAAEKFMATAKVLAKEAFVEHIRYLRENNHVH